MSIAGSWQAAYAALQKPELREVYARCVLGEPSEQLDPAALKRLAQAGLLAVDGTSVKVAGDHFSEALHSAAQARPQGAESYLQLGKIERMPQQYAAREALLAMLRDRLFEAQRRYSEAEVNGLLRVVTEDISGVRRALVDAQFLNRTADGAAYWIDQAHSVVDGGETQISG